MFKATRISVISKLFIPALLLVNNGIILSQSKLARARGSDVTTYSPVDTSCPQKHFEEAIKLSDKEIFWDSDRAKVSLAYCAVRIVPELKKVFKDNSFSENGKVFEELRRIARGGRGTFSATLTAFRSKLQSKNINPDNLGDINDFTEIAAFLGRLGEKDISISALINLLENQKNDLESSEKIGLLLGELGANDPKVFKKLIETLKSSSNGIARSSAALALSEIKGEVQVRTAISELDGVVENERNSIIVTNAMFTLLNLSKGKPKSISSSVTTAILSLGKLTDEELAKTGLDFGGQSTILKNRQLFIFRLLKDQMNNKIPILIEALKEKTTSTEQKIHIVNILTELGSQSKEAIPLLNQNIQEYIQTLEGIEKSDPYYTKKRNRIESDLVIATLEAIGSIGYSAKPSIPVIEKVLNSDPPPKVGTVALSALGRIDNVNSTVPTLLKLLQVDWQSPRDEYKVRNELFVLRSIGQAFKRIGSPSIPYLVAELQNSKLENRRVIYVLSEMGSLSKEIIEMLLTVVRDKKAEINSRRLAAYALEQNNVDVQWFFSQNNIVPLSKARCLKYTLFLKYAGGCDIPPANGGSTSLFDHIRDIFRRK